MKVLFSPILCSSCLVWNNNKIIFLLSWGNKQEKDGESCKKFMGLQFFLEHLKQFLWPPSFELHIMFHFPWLRYCGLQYTWWFSMYIIPKTQPSPMYPLLFPKICSQSASLLTPQNHTQFFLFVAGLLCIFIPYIYEKSLFISCPSDWLNWLNSFWYLPVPSIYCIILLKD